MNKLAQQIKGVYPDAVINNLTDYFLDDGPGPCASEMYKLTLDDLHKKYQKEFFK